jgi:hypothetical protein
MWDAHSQLCHLQWGELTAKQPGVHMGHLEIVDQCVEQPVASSDSKLGWDQGGWPWHLLDTQNLSNE